MIFDAIICNKRKDPLQYEAGLCWFCQSENKIAKYHRNMLRMRPTDDEDSSVESVGERAPTSLLSTTNETPGTFAFFKSLKDHLESQLAFPVLDMPPSFIQSLNCSQAATESLRQAKRVLDELQKQKDTVPKDQIDQAQRVVDAASSFRDQCNETVLLLAETLLKQTSPNEKSPSISDFLSNDFDDRKWVTFMVLRDPKMWSDWCCPEDGENPHPKRVVRALSFLLDVETQRRLLGDGAGGPRHGNYGGYLDIIDTLDSSAWEKEPVLERLAQAVALEFADNDYCYFDTTIPINPLSRYLHYEQAYIMGDLDPGFSSFTIWELRLAVNSLQQDWELQWGRECIQTYRPDLALLDDPQWRYSYLVRTDVGYMQPTFTSHPITMDQLLSGGGKFNDGFSPT
jgi:hypothetical protein